MIDRVPIMFDARNIEFDLNHETCDWMLVPWDSAELVAECDFPDCRVSRTPIRTLQRRRLCREREVASTHSRVAFAFHLGGNARIKRGDKYE
jgi:hypothetical protein